MDKILLKSDRRPSKLILIAIAASATVVFALIPHSGQIERVEASNLKDTAKSKAAFNEAVKVFFSARCANCHPGGDNPTQGDKMEPHAADIKRGPAGRGTEELQCSMCHQDKNTEGEGLPPGTPDWHMPGAEHKMSFQGITASQLCRNLKDPLQNGGRKTAKDAVDHLATDPKVQWAWSPGNGRTTPPMGRDEFLKKMNEWVARGAACPE